MSPSRGFDHAVDGPLDRGDAEDGGKREAVAPAELPVDDAAPEEDVEGREREAGDDVDEVVPAEKHRRADDLQDAEREDGPRVLERRVPSVDERENRQERGRAGVEAREDVLQRAGRVNPLEDEPPKETALELVVEVELVIR